MFVKKRTIILSLVVITFLCSCCVFFNGQEYHCEAENVQSIQIVRLDDYAEGEYRYNYTVLCEINDIATFVERLNSIEYDTNWGGPWPLYEGYVVIKIDYLNGDFDLLHPDEQWLHRSGKNHSGHVFFDEAQFDALISDYIQ